jgi:hypothetical protein
LNVGQFKNFGAAAIRYGSWEWVSSVAGEALCSFTAE